MLSYTPQRLKGLFSPRTIAVIGASSRNLWFSNMLDNARRTGFDGNIYPVNPRVEEVCGIKAFNTIDDLPGGMTDFAVIILKSSLAFDAIQGLAARGIKNILLISSGYAETGGQGIDKQNRLRQFCADNDIRLMGPNCLGFMNPGEHVSVFTGGAVEGDIFPGPVGVIAQSGATSEVIATRLLKNSLGISLYVTTGNEAVLNAEDYMEYLVHDESTRVITGFIEGFRNIAKLKAVAYEAAKRRIPIILIKVGRSEKAVAAATSHTGALAGNDQVLDGFFRQNGIIRVESIEELVETARVFARVSLPKGDGLGICTLSGGLCGLYADMCAEYGINLPSLGQKTVAGLKEILPDFAQPDNPLDVTGSGFTSGMDTIIDTLVQDERLDLIATLCIAPKGPEDELIHALNDSFMSRYHTCPKPVIPMIFKEMNEYARALFDEKGYYYIEQPQVGFKAISHLMRYAGFLRKGTI